MWCQPPRKPVLGIRIRRIRMFLALLDPDPFVRAMDRDPLRIPILPFSHKDVERNAYKLEF
jgi:hypothetical protein